MTKNLILRISQAEREGAAQQIASWVTELEEEIDAGLPKREHDFAQLVLDVQDSIQSFVDGLERDRRLVDLALQRIDPGNEDSIDKTNRFLQNYLDLGLQIHGHLQEAVRLASLSGHRIENAAELDKAADQYRRWKEDLPDRLMMEYTPVQQRIRERIAESLRNPPKESDWEDLFDG